jgi:hypothetical protein
MDAKIMRGLVTACAVGIALVMLSGCAGYEKGVDAGIGFDALNTQSKEDKENEKWFKSFYGKNHCYGNWASDCADEEHGGGGGGGMWTGGVGPTD